MKASLIIAFYNNISFLKLVAASIERQSEKDIEIILADDGSRPEPRQQATDILTQLQIPFQHLWQQDKGFRKTRLLNEAIRKAKTDYFIFIDQDCVLHKEFVAEHLLNAEDGVVLNGRRILLSQKITNILTPELVRNGWLEQNLWRIALDGLFGESFDVEKGLYFRSNFIRNAFNRKTRGLLGSNMSFSRQDIEKINGFDERYEAPGTGEDSDIDYRFQLAGIRKKSINHSAIQYHLYHSPSSRPHVNDELFMAIRKEKNPSTHFGIHPSPAFQRSES